MYLTYMSLHACAMLHVWTSEDNFQELTLFFQGILSLVKLRFSDFHGKHFFCFAILLAYVDYTD